MDFWPKLKTGIKESYLLGWLVPYIRRFRLQIDVVKRERNLARVARQYPTITRTEFIQDLQNALAKGAAYATGKIGATAQYMLNYEMILQNEIHTEKIRKFESRLEFMCLKQQGIFPADNEFYRLYSKVYMNHVRNLDCVGICYYPGELEILRHYRLANKFIYYVNQEPDRSSPSKEANCYLPYFRDKKILLICPFAEILKERATKDVFERVWLKTGKKWFYPKTVDALEFPYGFSPPTHKKYSTALDLFEEIRDAIQKKDFDIALIGAAGLAVPIASTVKSMGKIAIDLGGHLQIIFGVIGQRWRNWDDWKRDYFNEHWIDMPTKYSPKETDVCDSGAYW